MEFSKKLALFASSIFAFTIVYSAFTYMIKGTVSNDLMTAASTPFMVVITGYFAKSGVENCTKIKGVGKSE